MTILPSRLSLEVAGSLLIMAAAVLVVLSSAAILMLVPAVVLITVLVLAGGSLSLANGVFMWLLLLWCPAALLVAIHNAVVGLETINDPNGRALAKLLALSALIVVVFPPFWGLVLGWP